MQKLSQIHVKCVEELIGVSEQLGGCVFRGHGSRRWRLESTLERAASRWAIPPTPTSLRDREKALLSEFQRRAHRHIHDPPKVTDLLEWAALLQHYGGPTRLLDVTRSYFVAAFFAVERAEDDGIVWALNVARLSPIEEFDGRVTAQSASIKQANAAFAGDEREGVLLVEPFRMNIRLAVQQGAFLMPLSLNATFRDQLQQTLDICLEQSTDVLPHGAIGLSTASRIVIPRPHHSEIMRVLARANITAETLFGGLDGFARSLHTMMRLYD